MAEEKRPTVCINIPPGVRKNPLKSLLVRPLPGPEVKHSPTKSLILAPAQPTYKDLLQILYDATLISDRQGNVIDLNARALDFFLYTATEIRQARILDLVSGADDTLIPSIEQNLDSHRFTYIEAYCVRKDGSNFPAEIVVNRLATGDSYHLCFFIRDTTRRKKVEEELRKSNESLLELNRKLQDNQTQLFQSEKMAALGQIAAGVAHEINNPVGFARSNLNTLSEYVAGFKKLLTNYHSLQEKIEAGDQKGIADLLKEIRAIEQSEKIQDVMADVDGLVSQTIEGLERTKEIVRDLKVFARMDDSERQLANINEGIETTLKIIGNELKYKCELHKDLKPLPMIHCYPGQLNQVIMNLLLNASQAIVEKGTINLSTEASESHIIIKVADDGQGITPDHLNKIFTPFFTTKPAGKGTGLGLSISYGIIQKHNGTIDVQSEVGKGTTFTIMIPIEPV